MSKIFLVSCVSKKLEVKAAAENLYVSDWFKKARYYSEKNADDWFILSAKYGLVHHKDIIEPYNKSLNDMCRPECIQWAERVFTSIKASTQPDDTIVFLAGIRYRQDLIDKLLKCGYTVEVPLAHMGIGEQKSWFKKQETINEVTNNCTTT